MNCKWQIRLKMSEEQGLVTTHPLGESGAWADGAAVSSMGPMAYFIGFLKTSGRFGEWVKDCPLFLTSPNAPKKLDVPGDVQDKHAGAITSRPLALQGIARMTRHANQTTVEVTSTHSMTAVIAKALNKVSGLLQRIKMKAVAEQLTLTAKWSIILSAGFRYFLRGRLLGGTDRLAENYGLTEGQLPF
jgi:hypothetical protein